MNFMSSKVLYMWKNKTAMVFNGFSHDFGYTDCLNFTRLWIAISILKYSIQYTLNGQIIAELLDIFQALPVVITS